MDLFSNPDHVTSTTTRDTLGTSVICTLWLFSLLIIHNTPPFAKIQSPMLESAPVQEKNVAKRSDNLHLLGNHCGLGMGEDGERPHQSVGMARRVSIGHRPERPGKDRADRPTREIGDRRLGTNIHPPPHWSVRTTGYYSFRRDWYNHISVHPGESICVS